MKREKQVLIFCDSEPKLESIKNYTNAKYILFDHNLINSLSLQKVEKISIEEYITNETYNYFSNLSDRNWNFFLNQPITYAKYIMNANFSKQEQDVISSNI